MSRRMENKGLYVIAFGIIIYAGWCVYQAIKWLGDATGWWGMP